MENFGAVDEEPTTSFEMEIEKTVTVESVVETVMDTVADAVVETVADVADEAATGAHSIQGDTWLLNLTSLAEGLQGVNLTDGVNLQGWVLNITALVEDVPLSEYFPILSLKEYAQWLITLVVMAFPRSGSSSESRSGCASAAYARSARRRRETRPASPPNANASLERRARIRVRNA